LEIGWKEARESPFSNITYLLFNYKASFYNSIVFFLNMCKPQRLTQNSFG
jgi:hypothetical protein